MRKFFVSGIDRDGVPTWDTVKSARNRDEARRIAEDEFDLDCVSVHMDSFYAASRVEKLVSELSGKPRRSRKDSKKPANEKKEEVA